MIGCNLTWSRLQQTAWGSTRGSRRWRAISGLSTSREWLDGIGFGERRTKPTRLSWKWTGSDGFSGLMAGIRKWRWPKGNGPDRFNCLKTSSLSSRPLVALYERDRSASCRWKAAHVRYCLHAFRPVATALTKSGTGSVVQADVDECGAGRVRDQFNGLSLSIVSIS